MSMAHQFLEEVHKKKVVPAKFKGLNDINQDVENKINNYIDSIFKKQETLHENGIFKR